MNKLKERFRAFVEARPDICVEWSGAKNEHGYGVVKLDGKKRLVHRVIYIDVLGNDHTPVVRHKCHNRACANPHHLVGGTQAENIQDSVNAGRHAFGERNGRAKLTAERVKEIRERGRNEHKSALAVAFNLSTRAIDKIIKVQTWRHV